MPDETGAAGEGARVSLARSWEVGRPGKTATRTCDNPGAAATARERVGNAGTSNVRGTKVVTNQLLTREKRMRQGYFFFRSRGQEIVPLFHTVADFERAAVPRHGASISLPANGALASVGPDAHAPVLTASSAHTDSDGWWA